MARAVNSRRARLEVTKHIDDMMDRLCARHSIIDSGDCKAFPIEGLYVRCKVSFLYNCDIAAGAGCGSSVSRRMMIKLSCGLPGCSREARRPGKDRRRTETTGRASSVAMGPAGQSRSRSSSSCLTETKKLENGSKPNAAGDVCTGLRLLRPVLEWCVSALYFARRWEMDFPQALASNATELSNFHALVSQNLDLCQAPLLLGRVWRAHELRVGRQPKPSEILAVRWNDDDWWPATVDRVGAAVAGWKGEVSGLADARLVRTT